MTQFIGDFRTWLESTDRQAYVFCDLDETLLHCLDLDWSQGQRLPRHGGKEVNVGDRKQYVYERPHAREFLNSLQKKFKLYILTHAEEQYAKAVVKAFNYKEYIDDCFVTRNLSPNSLGERFQLDRHPWVLVDNMPFESIEIASKMKILGDEPSLKHFVHVEPWYPREKKFNDNVLVGALKEILHKLNGK